MQRLISIGIMILGGFLFSAPQAVAQNKVVVIPLYGDPAPVEKTGQTTSYVTGDDGHLKKGVAWPNPRFTDKGNGTVRANLTGLIWLKNANCFGQGSWTNAISLCNRLSNGSCGLADGSSEGEWHLPNRKELLSLIDLGRRAPAVSNTSGTGSWSEGDPFTGVQSAYYWSSTYYWDDINYAWCVSMEDAVVNPGAKSDNCYVWPVRGGNLCVRPRSRLKNGGKVDTGAKCL